jgi:Flp pilus assembly pilin Flp
MPRFLHQLWWDESGKNVADHAVMLAVILVILISMIRLICANSNNLFFQVNSALTQ